MQLCDLLPIAVLVHWKNGTSLFMLFPQEKFDEGTENNGIEEESQIKEWRSL